RVEGTVGGIPFKEDTNAPRPRSGETAGGAARKSNNDPGKKNVPPWRNCLEEREPPRGIERIRWLRLNERPRSCRYAVWENEAAESLL
ncbi:MAG TPA: hypothetical protein VL069_07685, partial [Opitutus sp.]|nr:hypothetical protein [Opitutus sp.]